MVVISSIQTKLNGQFRLNPFNEPFTEEAPFCLILIWCSLHICSPWWQETVCVLVFSLFIPLYRTVSERIKWEGEGLDWPPEAHHQETGIYISLVIRILIKINGKQWLEVRFGPNFPFHQSIDPYIICFSVWRCEKAPFIKQITFGLKACN